MFLDVVVLLLQELELLFVGFDKFGGLGFGKAVDDGFVTGIHDVDILEVPLVLFEDLFIHPKRYLGLLLQV